MLAVLLLATSLAFAQPAPTTEAASVEQLYQAAVKAYDAGGAPYEQAVQAVIARGSEAVDFLARRVETQADRVRSADDARKGGILVTVNLLGRMNSYPGARAALVKLRAHPVEDLGKWAAYALARAPQTRPSEKSATAPTTGTATGPSEVTRVETPDGWYALEGISKPPVPQAPTKVFVIPVREAISSKTFDATERKVAQAREGGVEMIVFDMDTWGGEVIAAMDIGRLLRDKLADVYTVCYVRTRAISAGAMIAIACNEIVMTPDGIFGAAAPISPGGKLEGVEREKIETVIRAVAEFSRKNGYPPALAQAMISADLEAWRIRNRITGELRYVVREKWSGRVSVPPGVSTAPSAPASDWELMEVIVPAGRLLTMNPDKAVEYGFASTIVTARRETPMQALMERFGATAEPVVLEDTWSEKLVELLIHPAVFSFLLFCATLLAYVEMHTPGFGIAGALAIVLFAIILGSRYMTGLANWWEIALFSLGVLLLVAEVFVTPGFGVLGISGIVCVLVSLLAILVSNDAGRLPVPDSSSAWSALTDGIVAIVIAFVASLIAAALLSRYLSSIPLANRLILRPAEAAAGPPVAADSPMLRVNVGDVGVVVSDCRPVGKVRFGEDHLDATGEGEMIPVGTKVRVIQHDGNRLIVERLADG